MYLKSIELHGFKSFSKKTVLEFHNGITGIVGPNGSGKSNISDAVRWVLGEQSAKQLRGVSMQDVIFAGTENRKALSYAYVSLTLDNADHVLPLDYEEVTISRRVYRSGESEYQINKVPCRRRDVQELFYDTGIGKEGYSIIGQGQIERILSSKPEERRELFDEAVGIVKYKKRKDATIKRLEEERANLERVTDILNELNARVGPLEEQAKAAKLFVQLREEQKRLEVNVYLLDNERLRTEEKEIIAARSDLKKELSNLQEKSEEINITYNAFEDDLKALEEHLNALYEKERQTTKTKGNLATQIELCKEQIHSATTQKESFKDRLQAMEGEEQSLKKELAELDEKKEKVEALLTNVKKRLQEASDYDKQLDEEIKTGSEKIEKLNEELISVINDRAGIKASEQRLDAMMEQENINKAQLNQRQLQQKTQIDQIEADAKELEVLSKKADEKAALILEEGNALQERFESLQEKHEEEKDKLNHLKETLSAVLSKSEQIRNISERYEGYNHAVRRIMDQKSKESGVLGVIADLISVKKEYETAIETALGGNIQNVVTKDEKSARKMIEYLKEQKAGRVTFLPLTDVKNPKELHGHEILEEPSVEGLACDLVKADDRYADVVTYLLGRIVVVKSLRDGQSLAKKYRFAHHIVTLEGEYLRPGGSITGGSFKNQSNLLSRNRELEELTKTAEKLEADIEKTLQKMDEYETALSLVSDDVEQKQEAYKEALLEKNTANIHFESAKAKLDEAHNLTDALKEERIEIEERLVSLTVKRDETNLQISESEKKEATLKEEIQELEDRVDEKRFMETTAARNLSEIQIEEASAGQEVNFVNENRTRVQNALEKNKADVQALTVQSQEAEKQIAEKEKQIDEIMQTILAADESFGSLQDEIKDTNEKKEKMGLQHRNFFEQKEEIAKEISRLEKEEVRLETKEERIKEESRNLNDHMWNEYELTLHAAMELKDDALDDAPSMKKDIARIREKIRSLGDVNVSAIEEYQEVEERHRFLTTQHGDIVEAEERLLAIIEELDEGMRERFTKGFADIKESFDHVFKELFGGGKGTLELADTEDILESGIRIIAQPPGKKLQNMMQLSGGEKTFTAIALLFAILALKPSPFCLLDEIEAALDEPNVDRFAKYLKNLTDKTQFILITHRRGTMNAADRLYGITMQEKGISALVSVNLIEDELDE